METIISILIIGGFIGIVNWIYKEYFPDHNKKLESEDIYKHDNENKDESKDSFKNILKPSVPIDREMFFHSLIAVVILGFLFSFLRKEVYWIDPETDMFIQIIIIGYFSSVWQTKRLLDIFPKINIKISCVVLFIMPIIFYSLTSLLSIFIDSLSFYGLFLYLIVPILFFIIFPVFLLSKKGS